MNFETALIDFFQATFSPPAVVVASDTKLSLQRSRRPQYHLIKTVHKEK